MEALYPYPFLPSTGRAETSPLARLYHRLSPPERLTAHLSTDAGVLQLVSSGFGFTIFSRLILAGLPASQRVTDTYRDRERWNRMSLHNIARSGIFSADRSVADYADTIWHVPYKK